MGKMSSAKLPLFRWGTSRSQLVMDEEMDGMHTKRLQIVWRKPDGSAVSCQEKLKVLSENLEELRQCFQDAFEDALLMGCDEAQVREVFERIALEIRNPYAK